MYTEVVGLRLMEVMRLRVPHAAIIVRDGKNAEACVVTLPTLEFATMIREKILRSKVEAKVG
jgi:hypothetical protein